MSEHRGDHRRKAYLSQDCMDGARKALENDPKGRAAFIHGHAYVMPSSASDDDEAVNIPLEATIAGVKFKLTFPFPRITVGQLRKKIESGEAEEFTNIFSRIKKKKR